MQREVKRPEALAALRRGDELHLVARLEAVRDDRIERRGRRRRELLDGLGLERVGAYRGGSAADDAVRLGEEERLRHLVPSLDEPDERIRRDPDPSALGELSETGAGIRRNDAQFRDEQSLKRRGVGRIRRDEEFEGGPGRGVREVLGLQPLPLLPLKGGGAGGKVPRQEVADDAKFEFCRVHEKISFPTQFFTQGGQNTFRLPSIRG